MTQQVQDQHWMQRALALAEAGQSLGEVPVGAVIVREGEVLGEGFNQPISGCDPTAHAEVVALREAARNVQNYRLPGATLYVTLEPCTMCIGALIHARIERLVYGTTEPKAGAVQSQSQLLDSDHYNHRIRHEGGVLAEQCQHQLSQFFQARRAQAKAEKQAENKPEAGEQKTDTEKTDTEKADTEKTEASKEKWLRSGCVSYRLRE